jgi:hypothetical protein
MNKIKAEIICDSINEFGNRITTFILTYPRIIHAELLTHRLFSKNSSSCLSGDTVITIEKPSELKKGRKMKHAGDFESMCKATRVLFIRNSNLILSHLKSNTRVRKGVTFYKTGKKYYFQQIKSNEKIN